MYSMGVNSLDLLGSSFLYSLSYLVTFLFVILYIHSNVCDFMLFCCVYFLILYPNLYHNG